MSRFVNWLFDKPIPYQDITTYESTFVHQKSNRVTDKDRNRLHFVAEMVPEDVKTLLDVGAKTGYFCSLLRDREIVARGLDDTIWPNIEPGIEVVRGDIRCLPFDDRSFDCVTAFEIIEHLTFPDVLQAVAELKRVARRYIMISVPYKEYPLGTPNHLQNFDEKKLEKAFATPLHFTYYDEFRAAQSLLARTINKGLRTLGLAGWQLGATRPRYIIAVYQIPQSETA